MRCGGCSSSLQGSWSFCPSCGKRVTHHGGVWEDPVRGVVELKIEQLREQHPDVGEGEE